MPQYRHYFFRKGDRHIINELYCVASFLPKGVYKHIPDPVGDLLEFVKDVDIVLEIKVTVLGEKKNER